jgi:hypothetical protein
MTKIISFDLDDPVTVMRLVERLASVEHEQWSHILRYFLDIGLVNLAHPKVEEYKRLAALPYAMLQSEKRESDRVWARKVVAVLGEMPKCGLCGSMLNLVGPYAGGPIPFFCESCKKIVDCYREKHADFKVFMANIVADAKIEAGMNSLFTLGNEF